MDYNISFAGTECIFISTFPNIGNYTITQWAGDKDPITTSTTNALLEVDKAPNGQIISSENQIMYEIALSVISGGEDEKFLKSLYQITRSNTRGAYPTFSMTIIKPNQEIITYIDARLINGTYFNGASGTVYGGSVWNFKAANLR